MPSSIKLQNLIHILLFYVCLCVSLQGQTILTYSSGPWQADAGTWTGSSSGWIDGADATFSSASAGSTVTLSGNVSAGNVTLSANNITVSGSPENSLSTNKITTNAAATISAPIIISGTGTGFFGFGSLTVSGTIGGTGNLTKSGNGPLILSGNNSYSGTTTILQGTIKIASDAPAGANGALGNSTTPVLLGANGNSNIITLQLSGTSRVSRAITVEAGNSGTISLGGVDTGSNTSLEGTILLNSNARITETAGGALEIKGGISTNTTGPKTLTFFPNATGNVTGSVLVSTNIISDGSGTIAVNHTGTGNTTFSAANDYTGGTTVSAGSLTITSTGSIGTGALTVSSTGTVTFQNTQPVSSLSMSGGTVNFDTQTLTSLSGTSGTISFPGKTLTISQTSSFSGTISASAGTLAKSGGGTLILSGGTGSIALGTGTLSISGNSTVDLSPTAATPISGTPILSLDNGKLLLGTNYSHTFGTLALNTNSNIIDFNNYAGATLNFSTLSGTGAVDIRNYDYGAGARLVIPNLTDPVRGQITFNGLAAVWATNATDGVLTAIPEPSTYAAAAGVLALGAAVIRRRRNANADVRAAKS